MPNEDKGFQTWYGQWSKKLGLNPDPDDPQHFYDYRAAYKAGVKPDASGHWPSQFKKEGHPNLYVKGVDTRTGLLQWNRPDEPGLEQPSIFLDPTTYIGGLGGVARRMIGRGVGRAIQPSLSTASKIDNLRRAARDIQARYSEKPMAENYQHVVEHLRKLTGE